MTTPTPTPTPTTPTTPTDGQVSLQRSAKTKKVGCLVHVVCKGSGDTRLLVDRNYDCLSVPLIMIA